MIVASVDADTTVAIAVSQEAKRCGIKTLTSVREARQKCPQIQVVIARPKVYKAYHEAIRMVAENVLPEEKVHSIDEMSYRLIGTEREPANAREIALRVKSEVCRHIGPCLTCSIGIAPNTFLAKIATEVEKPNGLVILEAHDLPGRLLNLKLTDLTGINVQMAKRLNAAMIFTTAELYNATRRELGLAFGSITGERWWYLLRGYDLKEIETERKSIGHSHVLPPSLRTEKGCREVILRLIQKASMRLRQENLYASKFRVYVKGIEKSWEQVISINPTQDTLLFNQEFKRMWECRDFISPLQVGITLSELREQGAVTPSLFDISADHSEFNSAMDAMNQRFGKNTIYVASMDQAKDAARESIAFNKTWLFSEGKNDQTVETKLNFESSDLENS